MKRIESYMSNGQVFGTDTLRSMVYGIRFYFRVSNAYWAHIRIDGIPRYFAWKTPDDIEIIRIGEGEIDR